MLFLWHYVFLCIEKSKRFFFYPPVANRWVILFKTSRLSVMHRSNLVRLFMVFCNALLFYTELLLFIFSLPKYIKCLWKIVTNGDQDEIKNKSNKIAWNNTGMRKKKYSATWKEKTHQTSAGQLIKKIMSP